MKNLCEGRVFFYTFILYQKGRNDNLDLFSELKIKTGKTNRKKKYETEKIQFIRELNRNYTQSLL